MKKIVKLILSIVMIISTLNMIIANTTSEVNTSYETDYINKLSKNTWTAIADSYQNASGKNDGSAANLVDDDYQSYWHSAYDGNAQTPNDQDLPHNVIIKFNDDLEPITFGAFSYTTRHSGDNGNIGEYKIYISKSKTELDFNSSEWGEPIKTGTFTTSGTMKVNFDQEYSATQIRFEVLTSQNGQKFASGAEFDLYGSARKPIDPSNFSLTIPASEETRTAFYGEKDSPAKTDSDSLKAILFDGSLYNYWQAASVDNMNADNSYLKIDLNENYYIDRIDLSKRYDPSAKFDCTGNINNALIETSLDGNEWITVFDGLTPHISDSLCAGTTRISFNETKARYIRISSTSTHHWDEAKKNKIMCLADISVYGINALETNLAKKSNVTFSVHNPDGTPGEYDATGRPLSRLTNDNITDNDYVDIHGTSSNRKLAYLQADLGELCLINSIKMYRYAGNTYPNTVILVSETSGFSEYTVVYNTDTTNIHGFGIGSDTQEAEVADGKEYTKNLPVKGRYIRIYSNGATNGSNDNHVTELQIFGSVVVDLHTTFSNVVDSEATIDTSNYVPESKYADELGQVVYTENMNVMPFRKYVTKKALSIKAQTRENGEYIDARFISTVPSVNLNFAKFKITVTNGDKVNEKESQKLTTVYSSLNSNFGEKLNLNYPKESFGNGASEYFFALKLNSIPKSFTGTIKVTPYWQPINEETLVEGVSRTFKVSGNTLIDAE